MATIVYEILSDVPEDLRDHATEVDGKYSVKVSPQAQIKEFRDNNIKLSTERDELSTAVAQYEQVTGVAIPDLHEGKLGDFAKQLEALRETKQRVDDGKLIEETSLEEAAAARVTTATDAFKTQLHQMAQERDAHKERAAAADKRADAMQVENAIRLAASDPDIAMYDKAVTLMLPNVLSVFKVEDSGKLVPKSSDGTIIYGHDGVTPMTMKEYLLKERETNDYLFKGAKGGGGTGSSDTTGHRLSPEEVMKIAPAERIRLARAGKL